MKFLLINEDRYPPFRVDVKVLFAEELVKRGHQIDWILQSEAPHNDYNIVTWKDTTVYLGPTDTGINVIARIRKNMMAFFNELRIFKLTCKNKYDIIQVKDKFIVALLALFIAKIRHIKMTYWLSYPLAEAEIYEAKQGVARYPALYYVRGRLYKLLLYKVIMKYADHVFVQSEQMKRDVVAEGVNQNKLTAVSMGISNSLLDFDASVVSMNESVKPYSIAYMGTLLKTRKLDFIIRTFAKVLEKFPVANLYMIGPEEFDGDLEVLMREAKRLNIEDRVIFTGGLEQKAALAMVSQMKVGLSPFYPTPILNSTSPTKLIEYMALKVPVVANDHPEQSLVIEESHGGLCVPYDVDLFADAILRILDDALLAKEMGCNGYKYVKANRTYHKLGSILENKYHEIVK